MSSHYRSNNYLSNIDNSSSMYYNNYRPNKTYDYGSTNYLNNRSSNGLYGSYSNITNRPVNGRTDKSGSNTTYLASPLFASSLTTTATTLPVSILKKTSNDGNESSSSSENGTIFTETIDIETINRTSRDHYPKRYESTPLSSRSSNNLYSTNYNNNKKERKVDIVTTVETTMSPIGQNYSLLTSTSPAFNNSTSSMRSAPDYRSTDSLYSASNSPNYKTITIEVDNDPQTAHNTDINDDLLCNCNCNANKTIVQVRTQSPGVDSTTHLSFESPSNNNKSVSPLPTSYSSSSIGKMTDWKTKNDDTYRRSSSSMNPLYNSARSFSNNSSCNNIDYQANTEYYCRSRSPSPMKYPSPPARFNETELETTTKSTSSTSFHSNDETAYSSSTTGDNDIMASVVSDIQLNNLDDLNTQVDYYMNEVTSSSSFSFFFVF
jgi:hypothetical protein